MALSTRDHPRQRANRTYVYSVLSRRAGGISVGVNLHPNQACNWACVYCQVPGLSRGVGPPIDLACLERELAAELFNVHDHAWREASNAGSARLKDIALSGDGEPTNSPHFAAALEVCLRVRAEAKLSDKVPLVVISNGSLVDTPPVLEALRALGQSHGRVWFKIDAISSELVLRLCGAKVHPERLLERLVVCAKACPTWIQTMLFDFEGPSMDAAERERYCAFLQRALEAGAPLRGVLLYGYARQSRQPEAARLSALPPSELESFAIRIRASTGLPVEVHV